MSDQFVVVTADRRRQLVRASDIQEIVSLMALTPMRGQGGSCRGMANLRGEIIPVFDLDGASVPLSPSRFILVTRLSTGPVGLIVDEIHDVVRVPEDHLAHRPMGGGRMALVARVEDDLLAVLEPTDVIGTAS